MLLYDLFILNSIEKLNEKIKTKQKFCMPLFSFNFLEYKKLNE